MGYPQQPKSGGSSKALWIILSIVGAVLIISCITGVVFVARSVGSGFSSITRTVDAEVTVQEFCTAVETQDYTTAYQHLSSNLQQTYSQDQFTQDNTNFDNTLGQVTSCSVSGQPVASGSQVSVTVNVERTPPSPTPDSSGNIGTSSPSNETGQVTLIQENGQWKIDSIDSSLSLL
jgi:hypothetical protein